MKTIFIFDSGRNLMHRTGQQLKMAQGKDKDQRIVKFVVNLFHYRVLAADRNINLDVYSGVVGNARLRDTSGNLQDIYLYVSGSTRQIPVPKLYYRIILNKSDNSGVVFIGVNNPHLTLDEIKKDYIVCTDVSSQINYIKWQKDNIERGYSYACSVNDFVKAVPHVSVSAGKLLVQTLKFVYRLGETITDDKMSYGRQKKLMQ